MDLRKFVLLIIIIIIINCFCKRTVHCSIGANVREHYNAGDISSSIYHLEEMRLQFRDKYIHSFGHTDDKVYLVFNITYAMSVRACMVWMNDVHILGEVFNIHDLSKEVIIVPEAILKHQASIVKFECLKQFTHLKYKFRLIVLKLKLIYFLLSPTSSMPLVLYNGTHTLVWIQRTHTYTYTVKYSTHTSIHTWQPFRRRYNGFFLNVRHTHSHTRGHCERPVPSWFLVHL